MAKQGEVRTDIPLYGPPTSDGRRLLAALAAANERADDAEAKNVELRKMLADLDRELHQAQRQRAQWRQRAEAAEALGRE